AGAALAGLAVPAAGEVGRLGGLQPVDDVEHDLTLVDLDVEVLDLAAGRVAAPDAEVALGAHYFASVLPAPGSASNSSSSVSVRYFDSSVRSNRVISSSRIFGSGLRSRCTSPDLSTEQTRLTLRQSGLIAGKSSRVWPPRDSSRSSAAFAVHSETTSMLRRSSARCHPGLYLRPPTAPTLATRSLSSCSRLSASV